MRPPSLAPLFIPVHALPGIGKRHANSLQKLVGPLAIDLLFHLPRSLIHWHNIPSILNTPEFQHISITLTVHSHHKPSPRTPLRILCHDENGHPLTLIYFQHNAYITKNLPIGEKRIVQGKLEYYQNQPQITHPAHILSAETLPNLIEPLYPLSSSLTQFALKKAIHSLLDNLPPIPEWIPEKTLQIQKWPSFHNALITSHTPKHQHDLKPTSPHRQRLAYDETIAHHISILKTRTDAKLYTKTIAFAPSHNFINSFHSLLPFSLTHDQQKSIHDIFLDMTQPSPMYRLLQGDVGSGKTVVAFAAMLAAAQNGFQTVLMAPTETLVHQHAQKLLPIAEHFGLSVHTLTGSKTSPLQKQTRQAIQDGTALIIIGTHSLFQNKSLFHNLRLAIIDEQQRFGVQQRLTLLRKGCDTDMLILTATPIPRTLMMIHYGTLNVSLLKEKPPGRKPITTRVTPLQRLHELEDALARHLSTKGLVYWVCPLVEEGQNPELTPVTTRADALAERFGQHNVAFIHGKIKGKERQLIIDNFASAKTPILVASTVIEVGIDVPAADVMIIEHAERFGLSQLHQLRGRVGRGQNNAFCILLTTPPLSPIAKERLAIMRESQDGFLIAEKDLELRGAGDILGTRQSGELQFHFIDTSAHKHILSLVSLDLSSHTIEEPHLLSLFQYDKALNLTKSG